MGMEQIEHIVLLMMENRSFDHYLGSLALEGRDVDGLGPHVPPNKLLGAADDDPGTVPFCLDDLDMGDLRDPPHEWKDVRRQWNEGAMDGFVRSYQEHYATQDPMTTGRMARHVMGYYTRKKLKVLYHLADEFVVCDRFHASFLGSTHPNRAFANAGACGDVLTTGIGSALASKPLPLWTTWDREAGAPNGITWRTYKLDSESSQFVMWPGMWWKFAGRGLPLQRFRSDCAAGKLPDVAIIEPPYTSADDHPTHDPVRGQKVMGWVVDALMTSKSWDNTALIITYDEHGGFFDHVKPEKAPGGLPEPLDRLGIRVPAIVASPFTPRQQTVHTLYDHCSVLRTIAERWNLPIPADRPRVAASASMWKDCFDFSQQPRSGTQTTVPSVSPSFAAKIDHATNAPVVSDLAQGYAQMSHLTTLQALDAMP
jgi:phospholipase C